MNEKVFSYPLIIKETYLDIFGHVNNATYLTLFEQARWEIITSNGYGVQKILETGLGPTILEIKLRFMKELRLRENIIIESKLISYEKKIGIMSQKMIRDGDICCEADIILGLFSLSKGKIVLPTPEWLRAVGIP